jgi:hypothetical protein
MMWETILKLVDGSVHITPPGVAFMFLYLVFYPNLSLYECFWSSFPLGYTVATWIIFVVSALHGSIDATLVRIVFGTLGGLFIILSLITAIKVKKSGHLFRRALREVFQETYLNILITISMAYISYIFYTHLLYEDRGRNLFAAGSIWADMPFHLNVINSFLHGENKYFDLFSKPKSTIYSGEAMSYPFIPDFHSSALHALGKI